MVERVGVDRVLFGSDAPAGDTAWSLRALRSLHLPDRQIAAMLGENAKRLFAGERDGAFS
jgi:predicted TIM-barrel fold metal-dependent hydrolase